MTISPEHIRRIKTNDLNDELVRIGLAGWLHQELARYHAIDVPAQELYASITQYVETVPTGLATAADLVESGLRPKDWPTKRRRT